jgi:hypothetical protein
MAMRSTLFALMQRKRSLLFLRQLWRRNKEKKKEGVKQKQIERTSHNREKKEKDNNL